MKKTINKTFVKLVALILGICSLMFCACDSEPVTSDTEKIKQFYDKVYESQQCLDAVADDIYTNWYNAIYKDYFYGSIDIAIASAVSNNNGNITVVEDNDEIIKSLYKEIRDSELSDEIKEVMSAYSDYYELVINVSGSFNTYSASKETYKKALASALKDLEMEL